MLLLINATFNYHYAEILNYQRNILEINNEDISLLICDRRFYYLSVFYVTKNRLLICGAMKVKVRSGIEHFAQDQNFQATRSLSLIVLTKSLLSQA